jgi:copper(I)-binding protein
MKARLMKAIAMNASRTLLGLAQLPAASAAVASAPAACLPTVEKGWIRAAPPTATVLAGYAVVRNDCKLPFILIGAKSKDFVMAQIHETKVVDGSMQMRHAKRTTVAANSLLKLESGHQHLMLMHPRRKLPEGAVVKLELLLEDGRRVPATLTVRKEAP